MVRAAEGEPPSRVVDIEASTGVRKVSTLSGPIRDTNDRVTGAVMSTEIFHGPRDAERKMRSSRCGR